MTSRLSAAARRDLSAIWTYSAERWNRAQADRYVRMFFDSFDEIAGGAIAGRRIDHVRPGYLAHAVGSHVVFYRVDAAGVIDVVRILHRRMDVERHL